MSISTLRIAALAAVVFPAFPAFAADDTEREQTIIVTGRTAADKAEQETDRTPGGADTVRHQDYADRTVVSLRDALTFSPGVYLQPRYGQEVRISIRGSGISRGFHMRGLTLLQDGVPINLADDNGDFQELEPIFLDHLQVFRGANAMRYGSSTLGGAVNGVTPRGADARGLYLRGDVGSFETARLLIAAGGVSGPGDFWAGASADTSNGDRQHARRRSARFHGNAGLDLGGGVTTRFYGSINAIYQQLPGALTLAQTLTSPRTGNFAGDQRRDITSIRVQNKTTVALPGGALELGAFYNDKSLFHPIFQVIDNASRDRGVFARANIASGPVEFTLGGDFRVGDTDARRFVNVNGRRGALTQDAVQRARTATLYGEVRWRPVASLSLIAGGILVDGWREQRIRFNGAPVNDFGRASYSQFSPRFGLLFEPTDAIQVYANASRSAELPGLGELGQVAAFVRLAAQRGWTYEIGSRGKMGIAEWDISLYQADLRGELLQFTVNPSIPATTFNAGTTRHRGIEAGLTLRPAEWLRLRQTYTLSDFTFRRDSQYGNNTLPVVPRHVWRGEVRVGSDALHVAVNGEWVPQGAWADYRNTTRTRSYALIGLTAGATVTRGVDLFLDLRNLTAKKAVGDISAVIAATPASVIYQPVERRAIYGGVRTRF